MNESKILTILQMFMNQKIFLIMTRLIFIFFYMPMFDTQYISKKIKILLIYCISYLISFSIIFNENQYLIQDIFCLFLYQIFLGICIGLIIKYLFSSFFLTSEILSSLLGLSFFSFFDNSIKSHSLILLRFLNIFIILTFLSIDGHLLLLKIFCKSFDFFPLMYYKINFYYLFSLIKFSSVIFYNGVLISLYIMFIILMVHIILLLLSRMVPNFSFFSLSVSIFFLLGMFLLRLFMPIIRMYLIFLFRKNITYLLFFLKNINNKI
ncbi:flagellar biosynthetic protein FliR [Buchnera aphidicola]|uniref:flagellar biosynthetic protein FliR n=1 Tax=Buchnera aphidicola TaxID=9 RepID=UPI0031B69714